jgi:hypothetical protein
MGNTWKIIFATAVIFAAGAVTGGLLVNFTLGGRGPRAERMQMQRAMNWQPGAGEMVRRGTNEIRPMLEQQRMDFVLRVQRELRLNPQQRERIEAIVRDSQERTKEFWERNQPDLRRMVQEAREKIRAELTPEQRTRFEELVKQQRPARAAESPGIGGRGAGEIRRPGAQGENQPNRPNRQPQAPRPGENTPPPQR